MNILHASVVASVALCMVPQVHAVDGVVLIDQNKALAGGVTPGDAAGFPVTLSKPGSYRLSGNLTVPAGTHGILIASPGVTLDLNGFTLASEGYGGGFPAAVTDGSTPGNPINQPRAEIRNGHIAGFASAVDMWKSRAIVVENLRVQALGSTYSIMVGPYSRVQRNIVDGMGAIFSDCPSVTTENITVHAITGTITGLGSCIYYHNRSSSYTAPISE